MATSLVDSPPAPSDGQAPPPQATSGAPSAAPAAPPSPAAQRSCAKCAAPMLAGQEWCLQCGSGAPGSLGAPGWRSAATMLVALAVLVLGAAAAATAALSKATSKPHVLTTTVAQALTPTPTPPPTAGTPVTPGALASPPAAKPALPLGAVKPPKIPLTAATPRASEKAIVPSPAPETKTSTPTSTAPSPSGSGPTGEPTNEEAQQSAILLDTNAATTYNPYNYPAGWFGDPTLAIDGDTSTAWSAQVNPATAPKLAEGLLIDLKAQHKVAVLQVVSSTPGMTIQVYGANGHTVPPSITDPAWVRLSTSKLVKKRRVRFKLRDSRKAFTFITLWISNAPAASLGSATAPGHVDVNEVELFPTG